MATFTHKLQGVADTTIDETDILWFAGATFATKMVVDAYNDTTLREYSEQ